jgi:predicted nucleotidyltransferase
MIDARMRSHVGTSLEAVAAEHGVRVLYAAESGSRAWGFASPDSDYDVRFIYVHQRDWYVSLRERRDVIERPLDEKLVDLSGWDIRKALRLLLRSNPVLYEWLVSPIVYADGPLRETLRGMFEAHAAPKALAHHYWSIAYGARKRGLEGRSEVKLKKYFYLVRPLLSLGWIAERASPPPMAIDALLREVPMPQAPRAAVEALLAEKRDTPEPGTRAPVAVIDDWAETEIVRLDPDKLGLSAQPRQDMREEADNLYRRVIGVVSA